MTRLLRRREPLFCLALLALTLPAIQPLLSADFTCGYDHGFHLWRAVEIEQMLRQSILFSRWAAHMAHGYGYPLFDFTAPASAYAAALLHLAGLTWGWALNLTFALGWVLSACTMYLFASDLFGQPAGLLAAALYTYTPYHAYDVLYRGGLSQASAWLFPPLILWGLRRAGGRWGFGVTALGFAGLILTHNAFALLFAPLIVAYLCWIWWTERVRAQRGGLALLLGLGVSAFFWLPALLDLRYVHSEQLRGAWVFEYANNFLPLQQLFAPPRAADPAWINEWPARGLGLIPALAALGGLCAAIWQISKSTTRRLAHSPIFFGVALLISLFLILPISRPVWDALPLLQQVQFPWRLVGPAALCASVLAAALVAALPPLPVLQAALLLMVVVPHFGWLYPRHCSPPADTSLAGMVAWERASDTLGTTAKGEYLPVWVQQMPAGDVGATDARLAPESLPAGAAILRANYRPTRAVIELETPVAFDARYLAFYYPGWRVTIDGAPVPITPTTPHGLISFPVPAGRHLIRIRFGETPLRLACDVLSILSLLILLVSRDQGAGSREQVHLPTSYSLLPLLACLLPLLLKLAVFDRMETPLRRAGLREGVLNVDAPARVVFGEELLLLGHDRLPRRVRSGERFEMMTCWQATRPGGPDYGFTIHLVDGRGYHWEGSDVRPSRWERTPPPAGEWPPDQYASSALSVPILPGTPPGVYEVELVAFDRATLAPLTAHDGAGNALGPALRLGQITIARPRRPAAPESLGVRARLDAPLGPLTLLGADFDRAEAAPGDSVLLVTFWRADQSPGADLTLHLTLITSDGAPAAQFDLPPAAQFDLPPAAPWHPTSAWQPGDVWRGQHLLRLPAALADGDYSWQLSLTPLLPNLLLPTTLHITAPSHTFTPPPADIALHTPLGDIAVLIGASLSPTPQSPITITLIWRAERTPAESYHVFLHLLASDGRLLAQSDGVPAGWTRPTTGWLPGEYIVDVHTLTLPPDAPPGEYTLRAGLYLPGGERLRAPDGADAAPVGVISVGESPP